MKRKKLLLALLIVNFIVLMGSAVFMHIAAIISDDGSSSINLTPLFIIFAGVLFILAIIEGVLGIFIYEEKRWAAIGLVLCGVINWTGIFGLVAALTVLTKQNEDTIPNDLPIAKNKLR